MADPRDPDDARPETTSGDPDREAASARPDDAEDSPAIAPLPASGAAVDPRPERPDRPAPLPVSASDSGGGLPLPGSGTLDRLAAGARDYAAGAVSANTARAYAADWAQYARWCRLHGAEALPPAPQVVGLYITDLATPKRRGGGLSVASIERRLSGIAWTCAQAGHRLDRQDRHIATVLAGIRRRHARPPVRKDALSAGDIRAMLATLPHDLRGLRDRAMLLVGFAGGLRRSEITGLDRRREDLDAEGGDGTGGGTGWAGIVPEGLLLTLRGKTGWREVEIGRGSEPATCPVAALEAWLRFARIDRPTGCPTGCSPGCGPLFRRTSRDGTRALPARLSPQHMALLVKRTAEAAGLRADLPEAERRALFSGHSLRAGLASHAEVDERLVQKHLGHASVEMTRRYQRQRGRFRVNLTKAAGL